MAWTGLIFLVFLNGLVAMHAWKFTHYAESGGEKPVAEHMTLGQKISAGLTGVSLPRARNTRAPLRPYEAFFLQSNKRIHCWWMPVERARGTVVFFHGYGSCKSQMLDRAEVFSDRNYNTLLVDFMGAGEAEGNTTTIGYKEAAQVATAARWARAKSDGPLILFGTSLGAAAVLKAAADGDVSPEGIVLECPFGTMLGAVESRCRAVGVPAFPVAHLLVFWGGVEGGFPAFNHNPAEYAEAVQCPALLMWGEKDPRVMRSETDAVFAALAGPKMRVDFPDLGHQSYVAADQYRWTAAVDSFLQTHSRLSR